MQKNFVDSNKRPRLIVKKTIIQTSKPIKEKLVQSHIGEYFGMVLVLLKEMDENKKSNDEIFIDLNNSTKSTSSNIRFKISSLKL